MRMFDSAIAFFKPWFMRFFYVMHFSCVMGFCNPLLKSDLMNGSICLSNFEVQHKIDSAQVLSLITDVMGWQNPLCSHEWGNRGEK